MPRRDLSKDQSYVLFGIRRELLPRLVFPVGEHRKDEIRQIAGRLGLRVAEKPDSQEICFVPDQDHASFVRQRRTPLDTSGEIVTTDGVGRWPARRVRAIHGRPAQGPGDRFGRAGYVVRIEPETRRVVLGTRQDLARTS